MSQMFGEPLYREAIRYQIGDRIPGPIVNQQILTILLVNAPSEGRFVGFGLLLLRRLLALLSLTGLFAERSFV
jgi:hypothetical protein